MWGVCVLSQYACSWKLLYIYIGGKGWDQNNSFSSWLDVHLSQ